MGAVLALAVAIGCSTRAADSLPSVGSTAAPRTPPASGSSSPSNDLRAWVTAVTLSPELPTKDQTLTATVQWQPQNRPATAVSYRWFVNTVEVPNANSNTLALAPFHTGEHVHVEVAISAGEKILATDRSLSAVIQNRPPNAPSGLVSLIQTAEGMTGSIDASDPDGEPVTIRLVSGPPGLTIDQRGALRWPLAQVTPGEHELTVELEDERGFGTRGVLSFTVEAGA